MRRAFPIRQIESELSRVEQHDLQLDPSTPRCYIDAGDWLVVPRFALQSLFRRPGDRHILPVTSGRPLLRVLKRYGRRDTMYLRSCAQVINIRRHFHRTRVVRTFYTFRNPPFTIKLLIDPKSGDNRLQHELYNRRIVSDVGRVNAPPIVATNLSGRSPFIIEAYIEGRLPSRARDSVLIASNLLRSLGAHYMCYGVTWRSLADCFGPNLAERVAEAAMRCAWQASWCDKSIFLTRCRDLINRDKDIACSFCHGDLNTDHVAIESDGTIVLFDWEAAREMSIVSDLIDLVKTCRHGKAALCEQCEALLKRIAASAAHLGAYDPAEQLFLGALRKIARWRELADRFEDEGRPDVLGHLLQRDFACANSVLSKHMSCLG